VDTIALVIKTSIVVSTAKDHAQATTHRASKPFVAMGETQTPFQIAQISAQVTAQEAPSSGPSTFRWESSVHLAVAVRRAILSSDSRHRLEMRRRSQSEASRISGTADTAAPDFWYNRAGRFKTRISRFTWHGLSVSGNARRVSDG